MFRQMNVVIKYLSLVLVIIFGISIQYIYSDGTDYTSTGGSDEPLVNKICHNDRFISVFNLGNDLIFQLADDFLKLTDCVDRDSGLEMLPYIRSNFVNDHRMRQYLKQYFNLSLPVFGFTYQFASRQCGEVIEDYLNECAQVYDDSRIFYACIYGYETKSGKIISIARKYNNSRIEEIQVIGLRLRNEQYCELRYQHPDSPLSKPGILSGTSFRLHHYPQIVTINASDDSSIGSNSSVSSTTAPADNVTDSDLNNATIFRPLYEDKITFMMFTTDTKNSSQQSSVHMLGYKFCKVYDEDLNNTATNNWLSGRRYYIPKSQVYHVFRYLNLTFACPQNCTLRSLLSIIDVSPELTVWYSGELFGTNQSLHSLFGCDSYDMVYVNNFSPNEFCADQRSQSVFTMGDDLYLQNNGRFWRRYDKRFTNPRGNPLPVLTLSSIVFDSDIARLLHEENIDITRPVMGFAFKYFTINPVSLSTCGNNKALLSVRCRLYLMPDNYRACIYGYKFSDKVSDNHQKQQQRMESLPFEYTPAGLRIMLNKYWVGSLELRDVYQETRSICDYILFKILEIPHVTKMHSITVLDRNSSYGYRQWFGIQAMVTVREPNKPEELQLIDAEISKQPHHIMNEADFVFNRTAIHVSVKLGLGNGEEKHTEYGMYYTNQSWIFSTRRTTRENMLSLKKILQKDMLTNHTHSLQSLYECPFNQSYTLVSDENHVRHGCTANSLVFQSVFNAGEQVYFQSGQRFYRYNKLRKKFVYDRYVTNLLNDHFDTKHRVIGYSYLNFGNQFRTVIVGRPKWRDLSLFNNQTLRTLYRMYYSIRNQLTALIPDNEAELYHVKYPFDTIDKQYLDINITSDSILGVGYLQRSMSWKQYKDRMLSNADLYPPGKQTNPLVVIYDKKDYNLLNISKNLIQLGGYPAPFEHLMPFSQEFQSMKTDYKRYYYKNIMGLFALDGDLYLVALKWDETEHMVLKINSGDDLSTSIVSDINFKDFFKCVAKNESFSSADQSSSGLSARIVVFIILLIILLIIVLVIAVMQYQSSISLQSSSSSTTVKPKSSNQSIGDKSNDSLATKSDDNNTNITTQTSTKSVD
ncbi:uncharacterized protein LOC128958223 [Oppia nitens]|uniref:uncharacterized protein LOC128958223 n=1 Tax=Oppia nitens TaxID=1686743 RepID=UPI0023DACA43|nr:uncharacterized protein LOC128958223 [Oppia nitens]